MNIFAVPVYKYEKHVGEPPEGCTFARLTAGDIDAVEGLMFDYDCYAAKDKEPIRCFIQAIYGGSCVGVFSDGELIAVGAYDLFYKGNIGLCVRKDKRSNGIGSALYKYVAGLMATHNYRCGYIEVENANIPFAERVCDGICVASKNAKGEAFWRGSV